MIGVQDPSGFQQLSTIVKQKEIELDTDQGILDFVVLKVLHDEDPKISTTLTMNYLRFITSGQILDCLPQGHEVSFLRFYTECLIPLVLNQSSQNALVKALEQYVLTHEQNIYSQLKKNEDPKIV